MSQRRVFEIELEEGKDLSGSSKSSTELSSPLNTANRCIKPKVWLLTTNSINLLKYGDLNQLLLPCKVAGWLEDGCLLVTRKNSRHKMRSLLILG